MSILPKPRRIFALILLAILIGNGLFVYYPGVVAAREANASTYQDPEQGESGRGHSGKVWKGNWPTQPRLGCLADGLACWMDINGAIG